MWNSANCSHFCSYTTWYANSGDCVIWRCHRSVTRTHCCSLQRDCWGRFSGIPLPYCWGRFSGMSLPYWFRRSIRYASHLGMHCLQHYKTLPFITDLSLHSLSVSVLLSSPYQSLQIDSKRPNHQSHSPPTLRIPWFISFSHFSVLIYCAEYIGLSILLTLWMQMQNHSFFIQWWKCAPPDS